MSDYIWIRNWEKFQHYKDRRPPWIKTYVELLDDDTYLNLPERQALLLHRLWLAFASSRLQLRFATTSLSIHVGMRVRKSDIDALNHAGYIEIIDSPELVQRLQRAMPRARARAREDLEVDKEPPHTPPQTRGGNGERITKKDLRQYTGCRRTRGTHGTGWKRDPLGTDRPPPDWPYPEPTLEEVLAARTGQA